MIDNIEHEIEASLIRPLAVSAMTGNGPVEYTGVKSRN